MVTNIVADILSIDQIRNNTTTTIISFAIKIKEIKMFEPFDARAQIIKTDFWGSLGKIPTEN